MDDETARSTEADRRRGGAPRAAAPNVRRTPRWACAGMLLVAGGTIACADRAGRAGTARQPNVLLVSIDSLRADRADGVSSPLPTGPRLRELARGGVAFTHGIAAAPWTTPSMMTVMTGLYPWSHHVRDHNFTLSSRILLLSERLKRAGYAMVRDLGAMSRW